MWRAGAAKVDVTPSEPMWLSGYANRTKPSEGVLAPIYVKAAAFQDSTGVTSVLVTSDLQGLDVGMIDEIATGVQKRFNVPRERLILNYSHNHSAPVTGQVLHLYYDLDPEQKAKVDRYTRRLVQQMIEVVGQSIHNLAPARLSFDQGLAGIAVNRRRARPGGRSLPGPVDQDVPVMAIRSADGKLSAILFGYSCHTTALSGYQINGDYAGFAQAELEKMYSGTTALFVQGCGGDANPLPRMMSTDSPEAVELARMYGKILARSVDLVLRGKMTELNGPLRTAYAVLQVPFRNPPSRESLQARLDQASGAKRRQIQYLLNKLEREGKLPSEHPYPVQVWRFGSGLSFIALTGESVVDYCLRFKKQYGNDNTWVAGYNNELLSYIPSLRVLREGGYEGVEDMDEYGLPAPYSFAVEELIAQKIDELMEATKPTPADWERRVADIKARMEEVMGPLPARSSEPLDMRIVDDVQTEKYSRQRITFVPERGDRVPAYLLIPHEHRARLPAMICLPGSSKPGKDTPVGLEGSKNLAYAHELAERGYVTLTVDYPLLHQREYKTDPYELGYVSTTMKAVVNHRAAVDLLRSLPYVDPNRIGVIGHSLGGHNALFLAIFDPHVRVVVSSCGFNVFAKHNGGNVTAWSRRYYMPRIETRYGNDPAKIPFDFTEVLSALAPRPVFINAPLHDAPDFEVSGVRDCVDAALPVYKEVFGKPENLVPVYPDAGHDFPSEARQQAYVFLDERLSKPE